ncbi:hypothetical protein P7K49_027329 [Saguinus oedipus]|uniref:Uncharacterized protein n=1 Tax=Saguinus oedipus TaxID=9490 RepID=A0ABQ9U9M1_SAGOE|nr:hypothetical protein P7K49_027329 [Saguinus oedipus]
MEVTAEEPEEPMEVIAQEEPEQPMEESMDVEVETHGQEEEKGGPRSDQGRPSTSRPLETQGNLASLDSSPRALKGSVQSEAHGVPSTHSPARGVLPFGKPDPAPAVLPGPVPGCSHWPEKAASQVLEKGQLPSSSGLQIRGKETQREDPAAPVATYMSQVPAPPPSPPSDLAHAAAGPLILPLPTSFPSSSGLHAVTRPHDLLRAFWTTLKPECPQATEPLPPLKRRAPRTHALVPPSPQPHGLAASSPPPRASSLVGIPCGSTTRPGPHSSPPHQQQPPAPRAPTAPTTVMSGLGRSSEPTGDLSWWKEAATTWGLSTCSRGKFQQHHLRNHPPEPAFWGDPTPKQTEAGEWTFIHPDVQKLLETLITKKAVMKLRQKKEGKGVDCPQMTPLRKEWDSMTPHPFWNQRAQPQQPPSP